MTGVMTRQRPRSRAPLRNVLPVRDFGRRLLGWLPRPGGDAAALVLTIDGKARYIPVGQCLPAEPGAAMPRIEQCYLVDNEIARALARAPAFVAAAPA